MPPPMDLEFQAQLDRDRADLLAYLGWWLRLGPEAKRLGPPSWLLEELLGALWLEWLETPQKPLKAALRRVLYREHEHHWGRCLHSLEPDQDSPRTNGSSDPLELHPPFAQWAEEYLNGDAPLGRLDFGVRLCGSRRLARWRHRCLVDQLTEGQFWLDLRRRAARLAARVAQEGALPQHRLEARSLGVILKMVEAGPWVDGLRETLSGIAAARTPAGRAGSGESASE